MSPTSPMHLLQMISEYAQDMSDMCENVAKESCTGCTRESSCRADMPRKVDSLFAAIRMYSDICRASKYAGTGVSDQHTLNRVLHPMSSVVMECTSLFPLRTISTTLTYLSPLQSAAKDFGIVMPLQMEVARSS